MPDGRHAHASDDRPSFRGVLRNRVFALLFIAEVQSLVGDQLARVALSVLVFEATGSAPATAATYAATLLPALFGGVVVARIGDRMSRRLVMVGCDLFRTFCFAALVIPGLPLGVLIALVVIAVVAGPVFSAAQVSTLAFVLGAEQFRAANGLRMIATQMGQVGGFVFGGVLVAALGPRPTLVLDAASFAISAALVFLACRAAGGVGPASASGSAETSGVPGKAAGGTVTPSPWRDRHVRNLVRLSLLVGFFVVPEGLAVPLGAALDATTWQVGAMLAAGGLGGAVGAAFVVRVGARYRIRASAVMATLCGIPLLATPLSTSWQVVAVAWFASGFLAAYVVEINSCAVQAVPDAVRASFVGTVGALLLAAQGAGLIGFGLLAQWTSAAHAIAAAGACGCVLALGAARAVTYTHRRVDLSAATRRVASGRASR